MTQQYRQNKEKFKDYENSIRWKYGRHGMAINTGSCPVISEVILQ